MSEQFQSGIYGGNLWNLSRDFFGSASCSISSSCDNQQLFDTTNNNINSPSRLSDDESTASDGSILLEHQEKSQQPTSGPRQDMIFINDQQAEENYYSNTSREAAIISSSSMINYWQQTIRLTDCCPQTIDKTCQSPSDISPNILPFDSYSYTNGTTSPLFSQNLLETDINRQQSLLENPQTNSSSSSNNLSHTFFHKDGQSPIVNPSYLRARLSHKPLTQPQFLPPLSHHGETKVNPRPLSAANEEERDIGSVAKKAVINHEPAMSKRPRVGTPSPLLPTFKVRKEKLGDRVTALQQLVSPFGKTDTASVLHEAIEYIKFLHDQVGALSGPYLKNGSHRLQRHREATHHHRLDNDDDDQASINFQDLKSHGLRLVPISSAFPLLASETTTDLWTPTLRLGQSFR